MLHPADVSLHVVEKKGGTARRGQKIHFFHVECQIDLAKRRHHVVYIQAE
jgi:hypothetical protein